MSLPPLPDSPSSLSISWPSESSTSPPLPPLLPQTELSEEQEGDRALEANELVEAITLAVLEVQEQQDQQAQKEHPSPLETTSRQLSPLETSGLQRGEQQHSGGEDLETPTQVFRTPISPSHRGVVGYESPDREEAEVDLPLLAALGETAADDPPPMEEEDKFVPQVEQEQPQTTEDKFQPKVEELPEPAFAPTVEEKLVVPIPSLAVTRPTLEMGGGNDVVMSEEEIEEIQRSPIFFRSLITVDTSPILSSNGGKPIIYASPVSTEGLRTSSAVSPPDRFGAAYWEETRPRQLEHQPSTISRRNSSTTRPPTHKHVLIPVPIGVTTSSDDSTSSSSSSESDDPPPGRQRSTVPNFAHPTQPAPSHSRTRAAPPPAESRARSNQHSTVPRVSQATRRTIVSSKVSSQRPLPSPQVSTQPRDIPHARRPAFPLESKLKPSVGELIDMLKLKLSEDETFRYVVRGVLSEFEEELGKRGGRRSAEEEKEGPRVSPLRRETPKSYFVQTDEESEVDVQLNLGRAPRHPPPRQASQPPVTRATGPHQRPTSPPRQQPAQRTPTSHPMSRQPIAHLPPAFAQHLASLTPRRIDPPPFHDPRDLSVAKKLSRRQRARDEGAGRQEKKRKGGRPDTSHQEKSSKRVDAPPALVRPIPLHPLSTTLPPRTPSISPETEAERAARPFVPRSATGVLAEASARAMIVGEGGRRIAGEEGKEGRHARPSNRFYRADPPREKPQRRHTIDQVREIEQQRAGQGRKSVGVPGEERRDDLKISKMMSPTSSPVVVKQPASSLSPRKKGTLVESKEGNRMPPPPRVSAQPTKQKSAMKSSGATVTSGTGGKSGRGGKAPRRRETVHDVAAFDFDDFA